MSQLGTTYLLTLAALSVTFVGFSGLVIMLRQTLGGDMSRLDVLITRIFIQLGFIVAGAALLPELMALFAVPEELIWRTASAAAALPALLFGLTYDTRRRAASGLATPFAVWIDIGVLLSAALILILNTIGLVVKPGPAPFALALTVILFLAGWAYLQALNMLLRRHHATRGGRDAGA